MESSIRRIGNSQGVIIPKPLLAQVGITTDVDLTIEDGAIVLRPPHAKPRTGWAEASKAIAVAHDDVLVWPDFGNPGDASLTW